MLQVRHPSALLGGSPVRTRNAIKASSVPRSSRLHTSLHACNAAGPHSAVPRRVKTATEAIPNKAAASNGSLDAQICVGPGTKVVAAVTVATVALAYAYTGEARAWGAARPTSSGNAPVERLLAPPPASTTVSSPVNHADDSMGLIVIVCVGFWMLSATISAAIGKIFKLSGNSNYKYRPATWSSAGVLDDIMRLPLSVEFEPAKPGPLSTQPVANGPEALLVPWDGPSGSYLPASMVKVLRPGFREAGLVTGRDASHLKPEISIVSRLVEDEEGSSSSGRQQNGYSNGNGNGNGNGKGNGRGNGHGDKPVSDA